VNRSFAKQLRSAMPDIRVLKIEFLMQVGDTIAWQRTLRGTHQTNMKGIPASGKKVEWTDMLVTRFEGEKIAEDWAVSELAGKLLLALPRMNSSSAP
jgi:predicted ester cyclase